MRKTRAPRSRNRPRDSAPVWARALVELAAQLRGNSAEALYQLFDMLGYGSKDFSGVLQMLRGNLGQL